MTNLEYHKDELKRYLKDESDLRYFRYWKTRGYDNFIDWLLEEHKEPIKLKQWEKDLVSLYDEDDEGYSIDYNFSSFLLLIRLKEKGYFKGIIDTSMKIEYILKNCEVIDD